MPYFSHVNTRETNTGRFVFRGAGVAGPPYGPVFTVNSQAVNFAYARQRTGTNATKQDLHRVFGGHNFELVTVRKTIGYKTVISRKKVWYLDGKSGKPRYRFEKIARRIPVKVRVVEHRLKRGPITPYSSGYYLKPNRLDFSSLHSFCVPRNMRVSYDLATPVGRWVGSLDLTGPGQYVSGAYYGPALTHGFPSYSALPALKTNQSVRDEALRKLYQKVFNDLPDYFTALAETPELFTLLKRIIVEGLKLVKEIYRLDLKRLSGRLNSDIKPSDLTDLWLAWIYGIQPVVNDVVKTIDVLSRTERTWRTFSTSDQLVTTDIDNSELNLSIDGSRTITQTYKSRYGVIIEGRLNVGRYLARATQPETTFGVLYQLVPFSFMLDWIADISSYLMSCNVLDKLQYDAWLTESYLREDSIAGKYSVNKLYPNQKWSSPHFTANRQAFRVVRAPLGELPDMPDIRVNKPVYDLTSFRRAFNAFSIGVSRIRL